MTTIVYTNDMYQVNVRHHTARMEGFPPMMHLSIKRRDKGVIGDWRELQEIKNRILSPEHEAVQLHPAEWRLMDTANQYHLWAFADPSTVFPFGFFSGRHVTEKMDGQTKRIRAVQRPTT